MRQTISRRLTMLAGLVMATVLAGCATQGKDESKDVVAKAPACQAAAPGDTAIGNWFAVRRAKGVKGELRTLFTLNPDGTMAYTELLKRSKQPSQGLSETGCWRKDGSTIVLRTLDSNGAEVDINDPIYTNRYTVVSLAGDKLEMRASDGTRINARRMSPGYRLPF